MGVTDGPGCDLCDGPHQSQDCPVPRGRIYEIRANWTADEAATNARWDAEMEQHYRIWPEDRPKEGT